MLTSVMSTKPSLPNDLIIPSLPVEDDIDSDQETDNGEDDDLIDSEEDVNDGIEIKTLSGLHIAVYTFELLFV